MKFDWSAFTETDFVAYCAQIENDKLYADDYIGAVRVGELCFDFVLRTYDDERLVLTFDCYVGGIGGENAYGYSRIEKGYPYEYAEGDDFDDTCISLTYAEFQQLAESKMERYIQEGQIWFTQTNLMERALMPLHVW